VTKRCGCARWFPGFVRSHLFVPEKITRQLKIDTTFQSGNNEAVLDLTDLRAFARIADLGSVSGAARSLRCPKSSVSRSLARLEASIGTSLIERSTRSLRLTDAGLLLHRHARRILDDVGEAENALGGLIGLPRGDLRVSVPFTFAAGPLAPMLPHFMKRYPEVRVLLSVDNRPVDLLVEEIDVAIRIGRLPDSELIARRLASFALWPCASPAYLAERGTPKVVDDLRNHTLIAHVDRRGPQAFRTPTGDTRQIELEPGPVVPEPAVAKTMLLGGAGIGWLPDFHAADALADGTLVRVLADHPADSVDAHALYPSHRSLSAKVRVFIDTLVAHLASDSHQGGGARAAAGLEHSTAALTDDRPTR
jgi:DNA-binding transcriptional LysR family regulator